MANVHYHVNIHTPGYLPEDSAYFRSVVNARSYMLELANQLREEGYRVSGNKRDGYYGEDPEKMYDLGRIIEMMDCREEECSEEDQW
jgi:uncharacterized protein YebE (UPF0316 family)